MDGFILPLETQRGNESVVDPAGSHPTEEMVKVEEISERLQKTKGRSTS